MFATRATVTGGVDAAGVEAADDDEGEGEAAAAARAAATVDTADDGWLCFDDDVEAAMISVPIGLAGGELTGAVPGVSMREGIGAVEDDGTG